MSGQKKSEGRDYIWIVGASTGIGEALAFELAGRGHSLGLSARNGKALAKLEKRLPGPPGKHIIAPLDVANLASLKSGLEKIKKSWKQIDRAIFMAGLYSPMKMGELDLAETEKILDVNLLGAFYFVEAILPILLKQRYGQIALCASVAGYRGLPNAQPYGASKAGLINLAESLAIDYGQKIDVKLICPGFVKTRLTDKNDFAMPLRITPDDAAKAIADGLMKKTFEIHFPKKFTLIMKLLTVLPHALYQRIMRKA